MCFYVPSGGKEELLCPPPPVQLDYLLRTFFAGFTERGRKTFIYSLRA